MEDRTYIGAQVAKYRRLRGMSQQQLADLIGRSQPYVSQIENGERAVDKRETLYALTTALRTSVADLTGQPYELMDTAQTEARAGIAEIERAAMNRGHDASERLEIHSTEVLVAQADAALILRMDDDYPALARILPTLISELYFHADFGGNTAVFEPANRALGRALFTASMMAKELGHAALALLLAQASREAADAVHDVTGNAVADYAISQVLLASGSPVRAYKIAMNAVATSDPEIDGMLALQAALAATAVSRERSAVASQWLSTARDHADEARELSRHPGVTGESYHLGFGPANVAIWEMSLAMERDEPGRVAEHGEKVNIAELATANRRSRFYIEHGRAQFRDGNPAGALGMLLRAENEAPNHVRTRPVVRELVGFMVRDARRRAVHPLLAELAKRCGAAPNTARMYNS